MSSRIAGTSPSWDFSAIHVTLPPVKAAFNVSGHRSPAYDLNPVPTEIKPRILTTAINEDDGTASLALAMSVAKYFELDEKDAGRIVREVGKAVSQWREEATRQGLSKNEIDRTASAFEHADLKAALTG